MNTDFVTAAAIALLMNVSLFAFGVTLVVKAPLIFAERGIFGAVLATYVFITGVLSVISFALLVIALG